MATATAKPKYPRPAWDAEIVECSTQAQMEKALKAAKVAKLIDGTFALICQTSDAPKVIVMPAASASIETRETSSPIIETWGTSSPRIVTWGTSSPSIVTWGTSSPRVNGDTTAIPLIYLSGLRWRVTITDTQMSIGCQSHKLNDWWTFDDRQIAAMDGKYALKFWREHKVALQGICAATGRGASEPGTEAEAA